MVRWIAASADLFVSYQEAIGFPATSALAIVFPEET